MTVSTGSSSKVELTLVKSVAGLSAQRKKIIRSLGLKNVSTKSVLPNTPVVLGQVNKVIDCLKVKII